MVQCDTICQPRVSIMPRPRPVQGYLSTDKAAELLGVSRSTFYRLLADGELKDVRVYKPRPVSHPRYSEDDLRRWLQARAMPTDPAET
jgi:excisionase family DNA binding protein